MRFELKVEDGETILARDEWDPSGRPPPIAFVFTNRALFLSATKALPSLKPNYLRRFPLAEIRQLEIRKLVSVPSRVVGSVLIAFGLLLLLNGLDRGYLWFFPLILFGLSVVPFTHRSRPGLVVTTTARRFKWMVPTATWLTSKERVLEMMRSILEVAKQNGVPVAEGASGPT